MIEKICPECQTQIPNNSKICSNCGCPVEEKKEKASTKIYEYDEVLQYASERFLKINHNGSVRPILLKVMSVLMLSMALIDISYFFTYLIDWTSDLFDFNLYTLKDFVCTIEHGITTIGFAFTGIILFSNKRSQYLKLGQLLILGGYALRVLECIIACIGGFDVVDLLALISTIAILLVWNVVLFKYDSNTKKDEGARKVSLLFSTEASLFFAFISGSGFGYGFVGLFMMLLEYSILTLYIWCSFEENTTNPGNGVYEDVENIYGYLEIWKLIVFSVFTMGIYLFIWIYRMVGLFNDKKIGEERSQVLQVVLCFFVPFYLIYWLYKQSKLTEEYTLKVGGRNNDFAMLSLILSIFGLGIVAILLIQDQINKNLLIENGSLERDVILSESQKIQMFEKTINNENQLDVIEKNQSNDRISNTDIEYLKKLKELNDIGVLTEKEYKAKKESVLKK